jgi:hypothetical protein
LTTADEPKPRCWLHQVEPKDKSSQLKTHRRVPISSKEASLCTGVGFALVAALIVLIESG